MPGIHRPIAAVAELGGRARPLDLTCAEVRMAVAAVVHVNDVYAGALGNDHG